MNGPPMTTQNRATLARLNHGIDRFLLGEIEMVDIRARLLSANDNLERDSTGISDEIYETEAELEIMQFDMDPEEQKSAASLLLSSLKDMIAAAVEQYP